ncbi:hypothetical protein FACS1894211_01470 [Clostridia bacterium]|nr:hypothetical protein FACS1894211_01470 [Clostridia bacterium]
MIIETFNLVHIGVLLLTAALCVVFWAVLRQFPQRKKELILVGVCVCNIVFFMVYKIILSRDPTFSGFTWWTELPLQFCNITMFVYIVGILTKKRQLLAYCFYAGPLGAFLALAAPDPAFLGISVFAGRCVGFYGTHLLIVVVGVSMCTLKLYRPRFKDLPWVVVIMFCLAAFMFLVNYIFRWTGLEPNANYFYTFGLPGNGVIEMMRGWTDVDFLYLWPAVLLVAAVSALETLPFWLSDRRKTVKVGKGRQIA